MIEGKFFWYDVMTTDTKAAAAFYKAVVGWGTEGVGGGEYTAFTAGGRGVAGLLPMNADMPANTKAFWMGYVLVKDLEGTIAKIEREGGKLHRPPVEVPGIIRFAVVSDPQGAGFLIATPQPSEAPGCAPGTPGTIGWHELYANDGAAVFPFYEKLFGWTKKDAVDMGPMGTYQLFATPGSDEAVGGMMTRPPNIPAAVWGYYFNVEAIDAAVERVKRAGGSIANGPQQVPGGQWVVQCTDPQGAMFALVANTR